jgi:PAS domain S-box-containing protein
LVFVKDTQHRFAFINSACIQQLGARRQEDVLGKTDADFVAPGLSAKYRAEDELVMSTGQAVTREERFQHPTLGEMRWAMTTKIPLKNEAGEVVGLLGVARDITGHKLAEEALSRERLTLRTLIDNLPVAIYAKDAAGRKTLANRGDLENLGCKVEAEAIGKSDFDLFPKEIAEKFWADDQKVIQGNPVINREEFIFREAGRKVWLTTSKLPLRDQNGTIVGLIGIGRDVTEIKEAEAKFEQVHKQLLDASRRAGMAEVATSVLHNVGNVLNSVNVKSYSVTECVRDSKVGNLAKVVALLREHEADLGQYITSDPKGRQLPKYLGQLADHLAGEQATALEGLAQLQKYIGHIKEIVAMQQNYSKASGVLESLPIVDLLEDALRMNAGSMERHNVAVVREYTDTPVMIMDKHKVLQILVNLVRNAKHACNDSAEPHKQIILRVKQEQQRVKISVIDNGIGIPAENLTKIFNHGFTTKKDGHGFGLHSGALAAKEMGGSVTVVSGGSGRGAAFTLDLPVQPSKARP